MRRRTIGAELASAGNALNAVRLVLATSVIVGHSWAVGGFGPSRFRHLGEAAVDGFFCISGFLIAGSRVRLPAGRFLWNRVLRIFPAYWVCLIVVAFVFAPLSVVLEDGTWQIGPAAHYVWSNWLLWVTTFDVPGTLQHVPYPRVWNGPMWTLYYEFCAYIGAGLLLSLPLVRRYATPACIALLACATVANPLANGPLEVTTGMFLQFIRLGSFFLAGMVLWSIKDRLPSDGRVAAVCAAIVVVLYFHSSVLFATVTPLPFAYVLLWLGGNVPTRIGARNDISYGMYIFAFPIQQLLASAGLQRLGIVPMIVGSIVCTIPVAAGSWIFIERRALRLKHLARVVGRRPVVESP